MGEDLTRHCARCAEHKSIRGVWYLVQKGDEAPPSFFCETCFSVAPRHDRAPAPVLDAAPSFPSSPALSNELEPGRSL